MNSLALAVIRFRNFLHNVLIIINCKTQPTTPRERCVMGNVRQGGRSMFEFGGEVAESALSNVEKWYFGPLFFHLGGGFPPCPA